MLHEEGNFSPHSGRWHGQNWTFPWCCLLRSPPGIKPSVYQQLRLWEYRTHIRSDTRTHENILCQILQLYRVNSFMQHYETVIISNRTKGLFCLFYMLLNRLIIAAQLTDSKSHTSNDVSVIEFSQKHNWVCTDYTLSYVLSNKYGNWHKILIWVSFLLCVNITES